MATSNTQLEWDIEIWLHCKSCLMPRFTSMWLTNPPFSFGTWYDHNLKETQISELIHLLLESLSARSKSNAPLRATRPRGSHLSRLALILSSMEPNPYMAPASWAQFHLSVNLAIKSCAKGVDDIKIWNFSSNKTLISLKAIVHTVQPAYSKVHGCKVLLDIRSIFGGSQNCMNGVTKCAESRDLSDE